MLVRKRRPRFLAGIPYCFVIRGQTTSAGSSFSFLFHKNVTLMLCIAREACFAVFLQMTDAVENIATEARAVRQERLNMFCMEQIREASFFFATLKDMARTGIPVEISAVFGRFVFDFYIIHCYSRFCHLFFKAHFDMRSTLCIYSTDFVVRASGMWVKSVVRALSWLQRRAT